MIWLFGRFGQWLGVQRKKWKLWRFRKRANRNLTAIKAEPARSSAYERWLHGPWMVRWNFPSIKLTLISSMRSVEEIIDSAGDLKVSHIEHEDDSCPGETIQEGLEKLLRGQPTNWTIRSAECRAYGRTLPEFGVLYLMLDQHLGEGKPNHAPVHDLCDVYFNKSVGPLELLLEIPYCSVLGENGIAWLRVNIAVEDGRMFIRSHKEP